MRGFEFGKEFLHVWTFALLILFEALANAFASICEGGDIEEPLIRLGVLHNSSGLSLDREHDRPFALPKLFQKGPRLAAEGGQRLDILVISSMIAILVLEHLSGCCRKNALSGLMSLGEALQVRSITARLAALLSLPCLIHFSSMSTKLKR
jgi:hypothetical protein